MFQPGARNQTLAAFFDQGAGHLIAGRGAADIHQRKGREPFQRLRLILGRVPLAHQADQVVLQHHLPRTA